MSATIPLFETGGRAAVQTEGPDSVEVTCESLGIPALFHQILTDRDGNPEPGAQPTDTAKKFFSRLASFVVKTLLGDAEGGRSFEEIHEAIQRHLKGELMRHAEAELLKACHRMNSENVFEKTEGGGGPEMERLRVICNLSFSPTVVSRLIASLGCPTTEGFVVAGITAVYEYMMAEVVECANFKRLQAITAAEADTATASAVTHTSAASAATAAAAQLIADYVDQFPGQFPEEVITAVQNASEAAAAAAAAAAEAAAALSPMIGNAPSDDQRLTENHIKKAIEEDEQLRHFFGDAIAEIDEDFRANASSSSPESSPEGEKGVHAERRGVKSLFVSFLSHFRGSRIWTSLKALCTKGRGKGLPSQVPSLSKPSPSEFSSESDSPDRIQSLKGILSRDGPANVIRSFQPISAEMLRETLQKFVNGGGEEDVRFVLDLGADLGLLRRKTALIWAVEVGSLEAVRMIAEAGGGLEVTDMQGYTALHVACTLRNRVEIVRYLVERGANVNAETEKGKRRRLHMAARVGESEVIALLLSRGAEIHAKDSVGHMALFCAKRECAEVLLNKGALVNERGVNLQTPLFFSSSLYAQSSGECRMLVELLVERGADVNLQDAGGETALHVAVRKGLRGGVEVLLDDGADIDIRNIAGQPVLHSLVAHAQRPLMSLSSALKVAKLLVARSALDVAENKQAAREAASDLPAKCPLRAYLLNVTKEEKAGQYVSGT